MNKPSSIFLSPWPCIIYFHVVVASLIVSKVLKGKKLNNCGVLVNIIGKGFVCLFCSVFYCMCVFTKDHTSNRLHKCFLLLFQMIQESPRKLDSEVLYYSPGIYLQLQGIF
jgi:hypothetical protein